MGKKLCFSMLSTNYIFKLSVGFRMTTDSGLPGTTQVRALKFPCPRKSLLRMQNILVLRNRYRRLEEKYKTHMAAQKTEAESKTLT